MNSRLPFPPYLRPAEFVGRMPDGQRVYRYAVKIVCTDTLSRDLGQSTTWWSVLSTTASDAANYARDAADWPPNTEIITTGPRGGRVRRYLGYESWIMREMMYRAVQEVLDLHHTPRILAP